MTINDLLNAYAFFDKFNMVDEKKQVKKILNKMLKITLKNLKNGQKNEQETKETEIS